MLYETAQYYPAYKSQVQPTPDDVLQERLRRGRPPSQLPPRAQPPFVRFSADPEEFSEQPEDKTVRFINRVYLFAGLLIFITTVQLLSIVFLLKERDKYMTIAGFVLLAVGFVLLIIFNLFAGVRRIFVLNYILAVLLVECLALGTIFVLPDYDIRYVALAIVIALTLLMLCYLLGAWLPKNILPNEIVIFIALGALMAVAIACLIMYFLTRDRRYELGFNGVLLVVVMISSLYHAQVVHGRRFEVIFKDNVFCAVTIGVHFVLLFTISHNLIQNIMQFKELNA
ncbi:uncharacterized protein LOC115626550 [Scaptodrosophila lebanonensis]|uniref:Uncharacterized protein LOC115626550 n=1 Tax=Drosophila lebanonensis TaxID=7225 RepID=A0A6J2TRP9_DROLE|nr:uncharacterized protein LOC115626550 [Scaptodrosophila lebanonensis]